MGSQDDVLAGLARWSVTTGDCLDQLAGMPAGSVDVVVTDPPAGITFMGRAWDDLKNYKPRTGRGNQLYHRLTGLLSPWEVGFAAFLTDVWVEVDRVLKPGGWAVAWALPKTSDLAGLALRSVGWELHDALLNLWGSGFPKSTSIDKQLDKLAGAERELGGGETVKKAAQRWAGWGTALSPGYEHWLLARKPSGLSYARTVLAHGVGGLNIDACRTGVSDSDRANLPTTAGIGRGTVYGDGTSPPYSMASGGRWPKNVLLSCAPDCTPAGHSASCPAGELDRQSGVTTSPTKVSRGATRQPGWGMAAQQDMPCHGDTGGASRFYPRFAYIPKARSRRVPGQPDPKANKHPTHKSPELMRWLVRLVCPTAVQTGQLAGVVLDPFTGSGTTGVAAMLEGCRFVGFERDPEHAEVARARVAEAEANPGYFSK